MKVVILSKGEMLSNLIEGTLDAGCDIAGIFRYERTCTNPLFLKLKDYFNASNDYTLIKRYKLHEIKCKSANSKEFKKEILKLNADIILVGTWHERLKKDIINLPAIASINVHPSLLPKYRGPNPYLQTILHQEKYSGITFHLMDENFDTGAILARKKVDIMPYDTSKELKERTVFQARIMCQEILKKLEYGMIIPIAQNESDASYYKNITQDDMMLDFEKETSDQICARIRALHPWLPTYIRYKDKYIIPNPYKLTILDEFQTKRLIRKPSKAGSIINADKKQHSITILCKDNKSIKADNIKIYGFWQRFIR